MISWQFLSADAQAFANSLREKSEQPVRLRRGIAKTVNSRHSFLAKKAIKRFLAPFSVLTNDH
jgi:hypothetical protein